MAGNDDALRAADPFLATRGADDALRAADPFLAPPKPAEQPPGAMRRLGDPLVDLTLGMGNVGQSAIGLMRMTGLGSHLPDSRPREFRPGGPLYDSELRKKYFPDDQLAIDTRPVMQSIAGYFSPQRQQAETEYEASKQQGLASQTGSLLTSPSLIAGRILQSAPAMGLSVMAGAGAPLGLRALAASGAEGVQAGGSIAQNVLEADPANLSGARAAGLAGGLGTALIGAAAGRIGGNIEGALASRLVGEAAHGYTGGLSSRIAKGAFGEGVEEAAQSGQEQAFTNLGMGRPAGEGVAASMLEGGVIGGVTGGAVAGLAGGTPRAPQQPAPVVKPQPTSQAPQATLPPAQAPQQAAGAPTEDSMLGGDEVKFARRSEPIFYSALERAVTSSTTAKASPEQWANTLKATPGVKSEELKWSGLDDWLKMQKGPVSKDDIAAFVKGNGVQVQEVELGRPKYSALSEDELRREYERVRGYPPEAYGEQLGRDAIIDELDNAVEEDVTQTKFSQYQLPGGKNYRELLLTLPSSRGALISERTAMEKRGALLQGNPNYAADRAKYDDLQQRISAAQDFNSSHFSQPNILAHIRFNERTDAEGKRVLFIEEIQSDWAQKGKKDGFALPVSETAPLDSEYRALVHKNAATVAAGQQPNPGDVARAQQLEAQLLKSDKAKTPSAPFVTKTDAWVSLAMKRMIRYAAENGFERVAWTNGEQQAARYDLSKQIDVLKFNKMPDGRVFWIAEKDGRRATGGDNTPEELDGVIGKELAEKVRSQIDNGPGQLRGLELKIGGEGMRAFYDKIVPNIAKELTRKLGGSGVKQIGMSSIDPRERTTFPVMTDEPDMQQPGFDITPDLRTKALGGLPLFARNSNMPSSSSQSGGGEQKAAASTSQTSQASGVAASGADIARLEDMAVSQGRGPAKDDRPYEPADLPDSHRLAPIARALGARVVGFRLSASLTQAQREAYGGFDGLTWRDGTIFLREDATRPHLALLGHEFAHQIAGQAPDLYGELVAALTLYIDAKKYRQEFVESDVAREAGDAAARMEEFIGEVFADGFLDPGFWKAVGERNPSLLRQVIDFLKGLIDQVKASARVFYAQPYLKDYDRVMTLAGRTLAEFTQREAGKSDAPAFSRRGPNIRRQLTPELEDALRKAGVIYDQPNLQERTAGLWKTFRASFVQGLFDQFRPIKDLSMKAYMLARLALGSDGGLEAIVMHGTPVMDSDGAIKVDLKGGGFIKTMQALEGEHDLFLAWVAAQRAEQLKAQGRENLLTNEDISALKTLNQGLLPSGKSRAQAYGEALTRMREINKSVLDIATRSGLIDAESRALWESDFYVPFYRNIEDGTSGPTVKSGLVNQTSIKKLKGGTQDLKDLMENTLRNWSHLLGASAKNRAALVAMNELTKIGGAIEAPEDSLRQMKKRGATDNVVYVMDRGRQRWFTIEDPHMADALMSLERMELPGFLKPMAAAKRLLTFGVTVTPAFKVTNLIRDSIAVIGQTKISANPFKNFYDGLQAMDKDSQVYADMLAGGGMFRYGTQYEGNRAKLTKRLIDAGVPAANILDSPNKVKALGAKIWNGYQELGDKAENLSRGALYKQMLANGMSHLEASYMSRDVMDFGLQGRWAAVRYLTQVVPFMNARLQGLYKLGRASKEDRARFIWTTAAMAAASIGLMLSQQDDEDWKKREDWDRDAYWWVKIGGQAYYIPKPFELGALGTLAERTVELGISPEMTGKRYLKRLGSMILDTFAMNPVPQLAKPILDLYSNKDSFTGRPIETLGMERLLTEDRASANTSEIAKGIGKAGILSPVQADHLLRGYMGGLGLGLQMATDALLRPALGRPEKPDWRLEDHPLLGRFVKDLPPAHSRYVTEFYEKTREIEAAAASYEDAKRRGDRARVAEIVEDKRPLLMLRKPAGKAREELGLINRHIKRITEDPNLPGEVKRQQIDRLRQIQQERARLFRQALPQ